MITIPAFSSYRIINKMKTSSRNLVTDLRGARGLAITSGREVKVTFQPGKSGQPHTSQYDYYQGNLAANSTAWTALTGPTSSPRKASRQLDAITYFPKGSTFQTFDPDPDATNLPNNLAVVFRPDGTIRPPAAAPSTTPPGWLMTIQTEVSTPKPQYQFFISATGRVLVQ